MNIKSAEIQSILTKLGERWINSGKYAFLQVYKKGSSDQEERKPKKYKIFFFYISKKTQKRPCYYDKL